MKYILPVVTFIFFSASAQQKESTVSISCYVNPELYIQAGVIAFVSDKAGNVSCKGTYISIFNKSNNTFYYKTGSDWAEVKPQTRTVAGGRQKKNGENSISILRLAVKYLPETASDITTKIKTIARMNAQSDTIKARESGSDVSAPKNTSSQQDRSPAIAVRPIIVPGSEAAPKKSKVVIGSSKTATKKKPLGKKAKSLKPGPDIGVAEVTEIENDTIPSAMLDSADYAALPCFLGSNVSYYTFYFSEQRGDTVLYTDPFTVERYDNSGDGERLLSKAWGCLSERIIQQLGEDRYNEMLNDVDHDLPTGILHLRDTDLTSAGIAADYPYASSLAGTQAELRNWIEFSRKKNPGVRFVRIRFP